jgi:predicted dehydrogenase
MSERAEVHRRRFLGTCAAAGLVAPYVARGADPTGEPVRLGFIGTGVRGGSLVREFVKTPGCKTVAVCDVYQPHMEKAVKYAQNPDAKRYVDYRELLADPKVEAVVIATPDHWHETMVLDAVAAGKDIYCEKGWTMSIGAAKRMREAIKRSGRVFQLGHQGREQTAPPVAGKMIRDGALGPVTMIHTGRYFNGTKERAPWRWYGWYSDYTHPDPKEVRAQLDWQRWLGPAPAIAFNERHFWHWRCYWAYGTGQAGDLLSHELDHVQQTLGWGIPDSCVCAGLNAFFDDDREVPDTWLATYQFQKQKATLQFEGIQNSKRQQPPEYLGKEGRLIFNNIGHNATEFWIYPDGNAWDPKKPLEPKFHFDSRTQPPAPSHCQDFITCVRTRQQPKCNVDEAFVEVATYLMSVEAYRRGRQVRWDTQREEIV